jgi:hypothetical protein
VNAQDVPNLWRAAARLILAVCAVSGCSRDQSAWQRVSVTGTVTYKAQAVTDGSISLRPVSETRGPAAGAAICDGRFEISEEHGPATGMYQAKLLVVIGDDSSSAKGKSRPTLRQNLNVRQFERSVKFTAGSNSLRFDLK